MLNQNDRYSAGRRVATLGIIVNIALLIMKLIVGYLAKSQAMISDGLNSMGDVFASVVTLMGSAYAAKPKDQDHVFGHGKAEYIASMLIGFSMIAMAIYAGVGSATALFEKQELVFSSWLVLVAVATILSKGILFSYCLKRGKQYNSILIMANAQDHRNDVFVTIGTLTAILLSLVGIHWVDGVVGIAIAGWIAFTGFGIIKNSSRVLMDENASEDVIHLYRDDVLLVDGVDHVDSIVAQPVGAKYILIVKVSVDKDMTVEKSHHIAKEIETLILNKRQEVEAVIVHINPDFPHEE